MSYMRRTTSCILTLLSVFVALPIWAISATELTGFEWEHLYGDDQHSCEYKAAAAFEEGLWVGGICTPSSSQVNSSQLWLWKINAQGQQQKRVAVKELESRRYADLNAIALLQNGHLAMVVDTVGSSALLVEVDDNGAIVSTHSLFTRGERRNISIEKMIPLPDQTMLLIGFKSRSDKTNTSDGFVAKVSLSGEAQWEKTVDRGQMEYFWDGLPLPDGRFILVGSTGLNGGYFAGASKIWIVIFDSKGEILSEKMFTGRLSHIASDSNGGFVIAYDKDTSTHPSIWVKALSPDLNVMWDVHVMDPGGMPEMSQIVSTSRGEFILAGIKVEKPWVVKVSGQGKIVWNVTNEGGDERTSSDCAVVSSQQQFYVVNAVSEEDKKGHLISKIHVLKFTDK